MAKSSGSTKISTSSNPKGVGKVSTAAQAANLVKKSQNRAAERLEAGDAKGYYIASAETRLYQTIENIRHAEEAQYKLQLKTNLSYQQWKKDEKRWKEKIKKLKSATGNYKKIFNE